MASFEPRHGKIRRGRHIDLKPGTRGPADGSGASPYRTSPDATATRNAQSDGLYKGGSARVFGLAHHVVSFPTVRRSTAGWFAWPAHLSRPRCAENARICRRPRILRLAAASAGVWPASRALGPWHVEEKGWSATRRLVCPTGLGLRSLDRSGLQSVAVHPSAEAAASRWDWLVICSLVPAQGETRCRSICTRPPIPPSQWRIS